MKKSLIVFSVIAAVILAVVVAWKIAYPTNSFRYKVTVNVETPEGLKSGFAVREYIIKQGIELGPESSPSQTTRGEAVVVDLGERGLLFATISSGDGFLVFNTFPEGPGGLTDEGARYYEQLEAQAVIDSLHYPLLVAFKDINDPKSVTIAYEPIKKLKDAPGYQYEVVGAEDHLPQLFGQGVRLKNITLEMTDEEVTKSIADYLPWLKEYYDKGFDGTRYEGGNAPPSLANKLSSGSFAANMGYSQYE